MGRQSWLAEVRSGAIGRNVVALGWTSFFTDISSEMVSAALPAYVIGYLGLGPLEFGAVDGIQRGAALVMGAIVAFGADRYGSRKGAAFAGYAISAACKLGLAVAGTAAATLGTLVLVDRTGKGLRTPARDALIAGSTEPRLLATAFGLHRAMDTVGAVLGPLVAFLVLMLAPGAFEALFQVSLCFAVVGLATLWLFVDESRTRAADRPRPSARAAAGLLVDPGFRPILLVAGALSLFTVSESFVYLVLQRGGTFEHERIPLLFVATACVEVVLTMFAARLADRVGRARVFLGGHLLLLAAYLVVVVPGLGFAQPVACVLCLGAFLAATDGVLAAMASARLPPELAASGLAIVGAITGSAKLIASLAFGAVWARTGADFAVLAFGAGVVVCLPIAAVALRARPAVRSEVDEPGS